MLAKICSITVDVLDSFKQLCGIRVLSERREYEDKVLDGVWVLLLEGLDLGEELLAVLMLSRLHQAVSLQCVEECTLRIFHQT